ncbi:MAG: hypothetical protein DI630_00625 [Gordonia sp. (in: high G+C Gram-positive bacteria)]|nr:MAG: hypothetical protein DI630_00625 [Gordonia sp. (in: high G+C Gram-positive bacteria)]
MFTTPVRIVLAVNGVLLCALAVLVVILLTRSSGPESPPLVQTDRGVSCVVGAQYISGGGPLPGYVFDADCYPVAPA